tara:strand:- start:65085 stop:65642 length:558 start_codon:yes stop_codon:yes gene_type:complete
MKFRNLLLVISLAVSLFACETEGFKLMDFEKFEMEVPSDWEIIQLKGIDSYVGGVITSEGDTLIFDLGWFSQDVEERDIAFEMDESYLENWKPNEEGMIPNDSAFIRAYKPHHSYQYDSIDCFKVKFVTPLDTLGGFSGVFIDSLKVDGVDVTKFNFYGWGLSDRTEKEFIAALKTISFSNSYCK